MRRRCVGVEPIVVTAMAKACRSRACR
jgi:hypothetical protein